MAEFVRDPKVSVVISDAQVIDGDGIVSSGSYFEDLRGGFAGSLPATLWRSRYLGCAMACPPLAAARGLADSSRCAHARYVARSTWRRLWPGRLCAAAVAAIPAARSECFAADLRIGAADHPLALGVVESAVAPLLRGFAATAPTGGELTMDSVLIGLLLGTTALSMLLTHRVAKYAVALGFARRAQRAQLAHRCDAARWRSVNGGGLRRRVCCSRSFGVMPAPLCIALLAGGTGVAAIGFIDDRRPLPAGAVGRSFRCRGLGRGVARWIAAHPHRGCAVVVRLDWCCVGCVGHRLVAESI